MGYDFSGQRFGALLVDKRDPNDRRLWLATCDCGSQCKVLSNKLVSGQTTRCHRSRCGLVALNPGEAFGRLRVEREVERDAKSGGRRWLCSCTCGGFVVVGCTDVRTGKTSSCGCLRREVTTTSCVTHGQSRSPTYKSWQSMIQRCTNSNLPEYRHYGGRGIRVCERWRDSFEDFLADMGERPPGRSIDRIDNDGHYEPGNCGWATPAEQARNQRRNKLEPHEPAQIRWLVTDEGFARKDVAEFFGVSSGMVDQICRGTAWRP